MRRTTRESASTQPFSRWWDPRVVPLQGEGSTSKLHVPQERLGVAASPHTPLTDVPSSPLPPASAPPTGKGEGRLDGISILLVEDDRDTRESLALVFEHMGARVVSVETAATALAEIVRERPDVLVSDIGLPGEDGYHLIRSVRLQDAGAGRRLPAIAVTAYVRVEDRVRSFVAGFDAHVDKPAEPNAIAELIRSLVPSRRTAG